VSLAQLRVLEARKPQQLGTSSRWPQAVMPVVAAGVAVALTSPALATATTAAGLTVMTRLDVAEQRIPTRVVHVTAAGVVVALAVAATTTGEWGRFLSAGLAAVVVAAAFVGAWLVGEVGFGDVRLAGVVTLTAGWHGLDVVLALWWLASIAALVGSLAARRRGDKQIALAPAIAVGWALAMVLAG
jgi:leader peptidase (prepilin peptidase) / N-methyltransferase